MRWVLPKFTRGEPLAVSLAQVGGQREVGTPNVDGSVFGSIDAKSRVKFQNFKCSCFLMYMFAMLVHRSVLSVLGSFRKYSVHFPDSATVTCKVSLNFDKIASIWLKPVYLGSVGW